ncbi:hypothetical protein CRENBAI_021594 [Crenichthys baileyi]|uniref:Uncharacterized protein n=1 Tax=Crenichthys baileyi TaxID=28760 RepID=A0AAV9SA02_9TELE
MPLLTSHLTTSNLLKNEPTPGTHIYNLQLPPLPPLHHRHPDFIEMPEAKKLVTLLLASSFQLTAPVYFSMPGLVCFHHFASPTPAPHHRHHPAVPSTGPHLSDAPYL